MPIPIAAVTCAGEAASENGGDCCGVEAEARAMTTAAEATDATDDRAFSIEREMRGKTMTPDMAARRALLEALLRRNGMELRDDSRLAHNFIVHDGDVALTAHELLCTNFLFARTNYDQLCQTGLRQLAEEMRRQYGLPWKQTWSYVREYGVPALKFYALAEAGEAMPFFDVTTPL